jgi:hypothetical protein
MCTIGAVFVTAGHAPIYIILAWACRVAVTYPLGIHLLKKYAGISVSQQLKPLITPLFCAATMAICVLAAQAAMADHGLPLLAVLLVSMAVGAISYAAMVLFMHRHALPELLASWRGNNAGTLRGAKTR